MERTKDHGGTDKDSITNLVEVDLRERERGRENSKGKGN